MTTAIKASAGTVKKATHPTDQAGTCGCKQASGQHGQLSVAHTG